MNTASGSRSQINSLIGQVNHLSVNGIMDHLLSLYICMRWAPGTDFLKLAQRELANTWVGEDMQAHMAEVTRDTVLSSFLKVDITSMRCGSEHHVEDTPGIEMLSTDLGTETPTSSMLHRIVERNLKNSEFGITKAVRELGRISNLNKVLFFDKARPDADSLYVADMRGRASRGGAGCRGPCSSARPKGTTTTSRRPTTCSF